MALHQIAPPAPATEDVGVPRLILRDGSSATVRVATPAARDELRRFFRELSPDSRRQRFMAAGQPPEAVVDQFCAPPNPLRELTLLAFRRVEGQDHIVAAATIFQHKTDLGVVRTNLASAGDVRRAFDDIMSRARCAVSDNRIEGVLIQSMVVGGIETLIGVTHDAAFGPLVGFGLGGTHVELVGDVRFRIAPLTDTDTDELLRETRGARLLAGYRGQPGADVDALREVVLRVSRLAEDIHEIRELDLNPVIALPSGHGCRVVDARIRVSIGSQSATP